MPVPDKAEQIEAKSFRYYRQSDVNYIPLHTAPSQACANCQWFHATGRWSDSPECHIVENWPESILATGWCDEWRETEPLPVPDPIPVVVVSDASIEIEFAEKVAALTIEERAQAKTVMEKLLKVLGVKTFGDAVGFKISEDGNRWEALYTNNWRDDDGELFPEAAIDRFIARVKTGQQPWPELQYAHLSGFAHGKADTLDRIGHHVLATGSFDDTDLAAKLREHGRKCIQEGRPLALSHRFWFNPKTRTDTGEYEDFDTFEISWFEVMPGVVPANPLTIWEMKTMGTQIAPELHKALSAIVGEDRLTTLLGVSDALDAKALADRRDSKTANTPTPAATPASAAPPEWKAKIDETNALIATTAEQVKAMAEAVVASNAGIMTRLTALESAQNTAAQAEKTRQELAPPGSRDPRNLLNPEAGAKQAALARFLDDEEQKTANSSKMSLVEFALGMKVVDDVPTEITTPGGQ